MELTKIYKDIITGKKEVKFSFLGLNLLFSRLINKYTKDPTPEVLQGCISEITQFTTKYERVVGTELATLKG